MRFHAQVARLDDGVSRGGFGKRNMSIATTIVPIFIVILVGLIIQRRHFLPPEFAGPANRLVYYVAIPAMIFGSVAKSDLTAWFNPLTIGITLAAAATVYAAAGFLHRFIGVDQDQVGTFIQSSGHGNIGYMGLAVASYHLGDVGLTHASVVGGFLMILQNVLSVTALAYHGSDARGSRSRFYFLGRILGNPVIVAVLAGMAFSISHLTMPIIVQRSLKIISDLALPTALLIIGGALSFDQVRLYWKMSLCTTMLKLLGLPAIGYVLFKLLGIRGEAMVSAMILMGCPTATVTYVMSKEMRGDLGLATAAITLSTLASAVTISMWLKLASA
jgi:predicted permease